MPSSFCSPEWGRDSGAFSTWTRAGAGRVGVGVGVAPGEAGRAAVALYGLLPLRLLDLFTYGAYEFESATRASVIVGAVAAGGIGTELVGSIQATDYHRVTTLILLLIALIAMGIVLVYRSSRVINFAVGDLGVPSAGLLVC